MADNFERNKGSGGAVMASREVDGVHFQSQGITSESFQGDNVGGVFGFMTNDGLAPTPLVPGPSNANANVDGSVTPQYFYYTPGAGFGARLQRIIVNIRDSGSLDAASYGNGLTLVNGIRLLLGTNGVPVDPLDPGDIVFDLTGGLNVFTNTDWGRYTLDLNVSTFGQGDEVLTARFDTATENRGKQFDGLVLNGNLGDWLAVEINDDLTPLENHLFFVQGVFGTIDDVGAQTAGL